MKGVRMFTKVRIILVLAICMVIATACGSNGYNNKPSHENASADTLNETKSIKSKTENEEESEEDLNTDETDGQISENKILGYSMDYDLTRKPIRYRIYEYDDHGNMTKETYYNNADGTIFSTDYQYYDNTYDSDGNLVKTVAYVPNDENVKTEIEYDVNGNILHYAWTNSLGEVKNEYYCEYDSSGCITKYAALNMDGVIEEFIVRKTEEGADIYKTDEDGQEVLLLRFDHIGKKSIRRQAGSDDNDIVCYMDQYGNQVKVITPDGIHYYKREYDDEGNMLSSCYYSPDSPEDAQITINHYFDLEQYLKSSDLYEDEPYEILKNETPEETIPVDVFDEFKE